MNIDVRPRNLYILCSFPKQLLRLKEEQKREHERKMVELREASCRMKEDCEHRIEIERFVGVHVNW